MSEDGIRVRGMYRVQIEEDGHIVGDSGWNKNQVVNLGFNWYLAGCLGDIANSSQVSYMALGIGTAPGAAHTALENEVESRTTVTAATSADSMAVRFTATFTSAQSFVTTTMSISNIGLFRSATVGTIFAGADYASSDVQTNQNVNATYDITFS
jgi:L-lactate permease